MNLLDRLLQWLSELPRREFDLAYLVLCTALLWATLGGLMLAGEL